MLDLYSGPNAPLAKAFNWCGWRVVTPVDLERDAELDISRPEVRQAIAGCLPQTSCIASAMSCATKSRAREKQPGPPPLGSVDFPRGLPNLSDQNLLRVTQDNFSSDYAIALQHWGHQHGMACLREKPLRSLHWEDPNEVSLHSQGGWFDFDYDACVFLGARKKAQRLRHNITDFLSLPTMRCGHIHDPHEWSKSGSRYPTFEEAEYTQSLVFTIAVTVTAWATRKGLRVEAIPRLPPVCQSGDVRSLLQFDAIELRSHLMDITGLHLGLQPPGHSGQDLAKRVSAADFLAQAKSLPPDAIYIGQGHFSHRWKPSKWASPFQVGRECAGATHVIKYAQWIAGQPQLLQSLLELQGRRLVCDCPHNILCHGDVLVCLLWHALTMQTAGASASHGPASLSTRMVSIMAAGARVVSAVPLALTQECAIAAFTSLCRDVHFEGFQWPMIEDLLMDEDVLWFSQWHQSEDWDGLPAFPCLGDRSSRVCTHFAVGDQPGAGAAAKATPPLIPFALGPDGHFVAALECQQVCTPFERTPVVDSDLLAAAYMSSREPASVRTSRQRACKWISELARRWQPVTDFIRQFQPEEVRLVTASRHIALIGLLLLLTQWPDHDLMFDLIFGFPAVGFAPHLPVYASQEATFISVQEVFASAWDDAQHILSSLKPGPFDETITQAGQEDEAKNFCGPSMTWTQLCEARTPFRLIKRFCIQQPSGKLRVIDDAAANGQSRLSQDGSKLDLCSAVQPGLNARLLWEAKTHLQGPESVLQDRLETGGEDLPNAYRYVPMRPADSWMAIVAYWDGGAGSPRFRRYYGQLFGLPLAVTAFNRWPRFFQALARRLGGLMTSLYFDDASIMDWRSGKGGAQSALLCFASAVGSPFAPEKHQTMSQEGDFLGLWHDFTMTHHTGQVQFWVRDRLNTKVTDFIHEALCSKRMTSGTASKLFGCLTFLTTGCYGKLGRAGLNVLKERQYSTETLVDGALEGALTRILGLLKLQPHRELPMIPLGMQRVIVASDAAQDAPRQGSAGSLVVDGLGQRFAYVMEVTEDLFCLWSNDEAKIAQLELMIVLMTIGHAIEHFRGQPGIWWIDNIAALMAVVRGRSNNSELDQMAGAIHAILYSAKCPMFFEWPFPGQLV